MLIISAQNNYFSKFCIFFWISFFIIILESVLIVILNSIHKKALIN